MRPFQFLFTVAVLSVIFDSASAQNSAGYGVRLAQAAEEKAAADINIQQAQEWLVWIGHYDGPIDGNAGAGTTNAIKRLQHELKTPESGILTPAQYASLAERGKAQSHAAGFTVTADSSTGIRIGLPFALVPQTKRASNGVNFLSADGRIQISLRAFKNDEDFKNIFDQLKGEFKSSKLAYSAFRTDWFVLSGDSLKKRFYLRYFSNKDMIVGVFAIYDKDLPKETLGPLAAAITMMSLTMQPFATTIKSSSIPKLSPVTLMEAANLAQHNLLETVAETVATPVKVDAAAPSAPPPPPVIGGAQLQRPVTTEGPGSLPGAEAATVRGLQQKVAQMEKAQKRIESQVAQQGTEISELVERSRATRSSMSGLKAGTIAVLILMVGYLLMRVLKPSLAKLGVRAHTAEEIAVASDVAHQADTTLSTQTAASVARNVAPPPMLHSAGLLSARIVGPILAIGGMISAVIVVVLAVQAISLLVGL